MDALITFLRDHQVLATYAALALLSAVAHAMPEPLPTGSRGYLFLYRFVHYAATNFGRAHAAGNGKPRNGTPA